MGKEPPALYLKLVIFLAIAFFVITQYILYADTKNVTILDIYYLRLDYVTHYDGALKTFDAKKDKESLQASKKESQSSIFEYSRQRRRITQKRSSVPLIVPYMQELFFGSITLDSSFPLTDTLKIKKWWWADEYSVLFVSLDDMSKPDMSKPDMSKPDMSKPDMSQQDVTSNVIEYVDEALINAPRISIIERNNAYLIKEWISYNLKNNKLHADIKIIINGHLL